MHCYVGVLHNWCYMVLHNCSLIPHLLSVHPRSLGLHIQKLIGSAGEVRLNLHIVS